MSMETNLQIEELNIPDYERVIHATNSDTGLDCFIAIHSTELGSAIGGARFWKYDKSHDAIEDVLRLAEGMTFKNSLAGLKAGGGKAVINLRNVEKTPDLLKSYGEAVDACEGTYITAEDVGSCPADMAVIAKTTKHVLTGSGDPSPATSLGVVKGMEAAVNFYRDEMAPGQSLKDLKVALQGLGHVGFYLAEMLVKKGVQLIATDTNESLCDKAKKELNIEIVEPDEIYDISCDIFAPCALGATVNSKTIPQLRCKIIAGGANNVLDIPKKHSIELMKKNILFAPDYAINAGGLINVSNELEGYNKDRAFNQAEKIYDTLMTIFHRANKEGITSSHAASLEAEDRIKSVASLKSFYLPYKQMFKIRDNK